MKTLVVDDEVVNRMKLQRIMGSFGECEAVESGSEAVIAFKNAWECWVPFELITLDISMPEMNGIEVLLEIRELENKKKVSSRKRVKILMVTAQADREHVTTSIMAGCDGYIMKPFDKEMIIEQIQKVGFKEDSGIKKKKLLIPDFSKVKVT